MTSKEARQFITSDNTSIGGIPLHTESKEQEIDPTIPQCWECGILYPEHNTINCPGPKRCLKCNSDAHKFFECPIPKNIDQMSEEHNSQRHCIPCQTKGDHTSLDHQFCTTKKTILNEKIKSLREKRKAEENSDKRDIDLIKKTLEISNTKTWPALHKYQHQQQKTSYIILLALLEENGNPGSLQTKLDTELNRNGLPTIKYNLGPDTARTVTNIICANNVSNSNSNHERTPIIIKTKQHGAGAANPPVSMSKYGKDTAKHIQRTNQDDIFNPSDNSVIHLDNKKQRIALPNTPIPTTAVSYTHLTLPTNGTV